MYKISFLLLISTLIFSLVGCEQPEESENEFSDRTINSQYVQFKLVRVSGPFEHPWSVAFLPDNSYLVTERPGRLNHIKNDTITEITGLPEIYARGQGGLMEVSIHPDFESNQWVYLTYSKGDRDGTATTLIRGTLSDGTLQNVEELFTQDRKSSPGRHYGSKLAWMADGTLLMSIGDRGGEPPRAQDNADHAGTLLRLNDDGSVPQDNPFVDQEGVHPEIFSYGHRNIQGLVVDPETQQIWATEHGPRGGDELNFVVAATNYGWPVVSQGRSYRTEDVYEFTQYRTLDGKTDPFYVLSPTLAPSGLAMITSDKFPRWKGNLLAGGLRAERIRRLVIEEGEVVHDEELLLQTIGRIREVREAPDGNIYILTDYNDGYMYRMEPTD